MKLWLSCQPSALMPTTPERPPPRWPQPSSVVGWTFTLNTHLQHQSLSVLVLTFFTASHCVACLDIMQICCAGTPLLGDQQLLDKYTYLSGSAVYLKQPAESDADAMARLISVPADEVCSHPAVLHHLKTTVLQNA